MTASLKQRLARRRAGGDEQTLPLINVVFLLLIFFMIAGRLATADPFPVTPATSASHTPLKPEWAVIHMGEGGRLAFRNRPVGRAELVDRVEAFLAANPGGRLRLKVDGGHRAGEVLRLLAALRRAGVEKVNLVTRPDRKS